MLVAAYFGQAFPGADKGFLGEVSPAFVVAYQAGEVGADLAVVLLKQGTEGGTVACSRLFYCIGE